MNNIKNRNSDSISKSSSIFFSNSLNQNNEERMDELSNSIIEDQFNRFKARNHYLRKSVIMVDSKNREMKDNINSIELIFNEVGFLMTNKIEYYGQLFLYLPGQNTSSRETNKSPYIKNNSEIYITNLVNIFEYINNINSSTIEFNNETNKPIYSISYIENEKAIEIFTWPILQNFLPQYTSEDDFKDKNKNNIMFFSFNYTTNNINISNSKIDNYCTIMKLKRPRIFLLQSRVIGYPLTSYFKITLGKTFSNIYKLKLLDISLPEIIFNINNERYTKNNYTTAVNNKIRFMMFDDHYSINNIDYVGARVKYDFWLKDAIYDIPGFNNNLYKFDITNSSKYPNYYVGNDIYKLMFNILNNIDTTDHFLDYTNNNIFEVAYFFMIQFNLFYNTDVFSYVNNDPTLDFNSFLRKQRNPELIKRIFYIYTSEIIDNNTNDNKYILREDNEQLNIQNPLMYFNDFLLYVNTETYELNLGICNWMDRIILDKSLNYGEKNGWFELFCLINNIDERVVGYIQDNPSKYIDNKNLYYTISIYNLIHRFNPNSLNNQPIFALLNNNINYIQNNVSQFLKYDSVNNTYSYRIYKNFTATEDYKNINTHLFHYNSTVFRNISQELINTSSVKNNYISYVMLLTIESTLSTPESIVGSVIYSEQTNNTVNQQSTIINNNGTIFLHGATNETNVATSNRVLIENTVNQYIGMVTINTISYYAYIMYSFEQLSFFKEALVFKNINDNDNIGRVYEILDTYYNIRLNKIITGFVPGSIYSLENNSKPNFLLKKLDDNANYLAAYSSVSFTNYRQNMLIQGDTISLNSQENQYRVLRSYEPIGIIKDVQFELILDASIYSNYNINLSETSEFNNTNQVTALQTRNIMAPQTIRIPLDNIRIIETRTQINYNVIDYKGKVILLKNDKGVEFYCDILKQPILDKNINMFVFELSLKTPNINIGTIYTQNNFVCTIDNIIIGTGYSIYHSVELYKIIIEKSNSFQLEYLQNYGKYIYTKNLNSKFVKEQTFINRNCSIKNPVKTNMTGFKNYDLIPYYEISLSNGNYTNETLISQIETQLNNNIYANYDYYQKVLKAGDINNLQINNPNFETYRFKVLYDSTTKKNEIKSYKVLNNIEFTAIYNPITPFIFFIIKSANVINNNRLYIEVLRDVANNSITNEVAKRLNKEFTTRILPIFKYEIRIINPVIDLQNINNISNKNRIIPENITNILDQIKLSPFNFRANYPGLNEKMRYIGQTLINMYNNNNTYVGNGNISNNAGIPCNFIENELVIVIDNIYFNYESYKIGRIIRIDDKTSNYKGNYSINIQLCGETEVSQPIFIGDVIYGFRSDTIGCVVPYEWGTLNEYPEIKELHNCLPTEDIIKLGYKNYLKYLYKYSNKEYLLNYINEYSLEAFNHYNPFFQDNTFSNYYNIFTSFFYPYFNWPLIELKNCYIGFEIPFDFPVEFTITNTDIVLNFLKTNQYCLLVGKNSNDEYDTPKDILGYSESNILNINDYINPTNKIPWKKSFDNTIAYDQQYITKIYMTYGSDNIIQNKMYIELLDSSNYRIGDTVYLQNTNVRPIIQRNLLDIMNTSEVNIKNIFTFDIYLTFLSIRLAFIKSGIPISMGPNDYLGILKNDRLSSFYMWQVFMMSIPNSLYVSSDNDYKIIALINLINENFGTNLNNNMYNNLDENITHNLNDVPKLNSTNISQDYAFIINNVILNKILPWFIVKENILLWTKGCFDIYLYILETYIYIADKNIWRFELELLDNFIFKEKIIVKDKNGIVIGVATFNNLYKDSEPNNNITYILYIKVDSNYNVSDNLNIKDYIYTEDSLIKNRIKTKPILVTDANKYIYLYDTYLKFKTIVQIVPDNTDTLQKCLNFNYYNNINSVFMNLYNFDTQHITSFKNGYFISMKVNEKFQKNDDQLNGQYRIMINMLDNKNLLKLCFDKETGLGLIDNIEQIKNNIINLNENASKDIIQIRKLLDIFQLLVDLSPINTIMVDLDYTQKLENNIHKTFQYKARVIDNIFNICGSLNAFLENTSYQNKFIYGDADIPSADLNLYLSNQFKKVYSEESVRKFKSEGTQSIEQNMCNLEQIYRIYQNNTNNADFNSIFNIFNEPSTFNYGALWVPIQSGDRYLYIISPSYDPLRASGINKSVVLLNKNILDNFLITINFLYIDQLKSVDVNNIEKNEIIQTNIIESISYVQYSNELNDINRLPKYTKIGNQIKSEKLVTYRIFKINLKFPVKYNVNRGCLVQIKDYYTTIYKTPNSKIKGSYKLYILKNWYTDKQFVLKPGYTVTINYCSHNSIYQNYNQKSNNFTDMLTSFEIDDIINEQTNIINSINPNTITIEGKTYIEILLNSPLKYEFKSELPIIIMFNPLNNSSYTRCQLAGDFDVPFQQISDTIANDNNILTNCLSTQNIIVNNEWYTKIYYQSEKNIDLYQINNAGIKGINNLSNKQVYISGMKGFCCTNIGFQQIERNYYNSDEVTFENNQQNPYLKPVPNDIYKIVYFQKEDNNDILDSKYDNDIPGYFDTIYSNTTPDQLDEWIDYYENIRWFYAFENENKNIDVATFKKIDLFYINENHIKSAPNTLVTFDKLCSVLKIEDTNEVFEGFKLYKVYIVMNIKNIMNNFLYSQLIFNTIFFSNPNQPNNVIILSTKDKLYNFKIIYFGLRESVDVDYSNTFKKNNFHSITIKGRYQGFGGTISFNTKSSIFDDISFNITNVNRKYNTIELDLAANKGIICSYFRNNSTGFRRTIFDIYKQNYNKNPINNTLINPIFSGFNTTPLQLFNYIQNPNELLTFNNIFPSKYGYIADQGMIYKKKINKPQDVKVNDYIYLCFNNIETNNIVEQNNNIGNNIIFAKIYTKITDINNFFLDYSNYEVIFDLNLLPSLYELEVFFLTKTGNLVNFNNLDVNFQLEIHEYVERVKNINTHNGMVF